MLRTLSKLFVAFMVIGWIAALYAQPLSANEVVGLLTVHSDINGQKSSSLLLNLRGHSWLSFESLDRKVSWTVGTWDEGIHVEGHTSRKGVNFNLEAKRHPGAYRRIAITRSQYQKLATAIKRNDEWTSIRNCSYFARTVWNEVTGEHLDNWSEVQDRELREFFFGNDFGVHRTIPLPSPSGLFDWIFISNGDYFNNDDDALRTRYEEANYSVQENVAR